MFIHHFHTPGIILQIVTIIDFLDMRNVREVTANSPRVAQLRNGRCGIHKEACLTSRACNQP